MCHRMIISFHDEEKHTSKKMNPLRICYLYTHCMLDFVEGCDIPEFKFAKNIYRDATLTPYRGFNITFLSKTENRTSQEETDFIDDCVTSLQANESDTIFTHYSMPIVRDHILTTQVIDDVKIKMLATYNAIIIADNYDVMESFNTFSLTTVLVLSALVFFTTFVLFMSLSIHGKTSRWKRHCRILDMFLLVFGITLRNYSYVTARMKSICSSRMLVTSVVFLMFFIGFFYLSMIKTDQVTVKIPKVLASYQDIEDDEEARPVLFKFSDAFHLFRNADSTSFRYKVWKRVLKFGINETVLDLSVSNYYRIQELMMNKTALITYSDLMQNLELSAHQYMSGTDIRGLTSSDQQEPRILRSMLFNDRFDPSSIKVISKRQMFVLESGLLARNLVIAGRHILTNVIGMITGKGKDFWTLREYVSDRVILGHPQILKLDIRCFKGVFLLLISSYFLGLIVEKHVHKSISNVKRPVLVVIT